MPDFPDLVCPRCQTVFPSRIGSNTVGARFRFTDCSQICPNCNAPVPIPDGTFISTDTAFVRIYDAAPTVEELEALIRVLTTTGQATPEAAAAAVEEEVPRLAPFLTDYFGLSLAKWGDVLAPLLLVLGCLLTLTKEISVENGIKLAGAFAAAARVALKKEKAPSDPEDAARRGAEIAIQAMQDERRKRNKKKRERKQRRG